MELPGDIENPPFAVVVDRLSGDLERAVDQMGAEWDGKTLAREIGARCVLFFRDEVQIGEDL